jgi:hypothetical protein
MELSPGDVVRIIHNVHNLELWSEPYPQQAGAFVGLLKNTDVALIVSSEKVEDRDLRFMTHKVYTSRGLAGWVHDERLLMWV